MPASRGRFITLEGGEGSGKSTQARRLVEALAREGIRTVSTREPGGSPRAEEIRTMLLAGGAEPFGPVAETLLFYAARADHLDVTIRPALARGRWVVCDRFSDSTRAYQGSLGRVDRRLLDALERVIVGSTRPDLTILLDVPAEAGLARASARRPPGAATDRFEAQSLAFHQKLRRAFLTIAQDDPQRCVIVDGLGTPDEVFEAIWAAVSERLLAGARPARRRAAGA